MRFERILQPDAHLVENVGYAAEFVALAGKNAWGQVALAYLARGIFQQTQGFNDRARNIPCEKSVGQNKNYESPKGSPKKKTAEHCHPYAVLPANFKAGDRHVR